MARIAYDDRDASAFEAGRHIAEEGLVAWREAVTRHLKPGPGMRLLDLGAGTGMWASAFTAWYDGMDVIAVEPSDAMRTRCRYPRERGEADEVAETVVADRFDLPGWRRFHFVGRDPGSGRRTCFPRN